MKRILFFAAVLAMAACAENVTVDENPVERVVLFDQDGKQWDVTQAVLRYGFDPEKFLFGFGAFDVPPLINPTMLVFGDSTFPAPDTMFAVAALGINSDYRAYGISELQNFEVINDAVDSRAVALVYHPLSDAIGAYYRTTDGTTLILSASGWAYGERNILFDYGTESLWYPLDGSGLLTCINGAFFGNTLPAVAFTRSAWDDWYAAHPGTRVLVLPR